MATALDNRWGLSASTRNVDASFYASVQGLKLYLSAQLRLAQYLLGWCPVCQWPRV